MKKRDKILSLSLTLIIIGSALFFCSFAPSSQSGSFVRLPAETQIRQLADKDKAAYIGNWGEDDRIWSVRSAASVDFYNPALILAAQFVIDAPDIIVEAASSSGADAPRLAPLLLQDGANSPKLFAAQPYPDGDLLDIYGHPLRWRLPDNLLTGYSLFRPSEPETPVAKAKAAVIPRVPYAQRASYYREIVKGFARRFNLNVDLVMAIIHSESDFSPHLVSNKSAMGLMQLLPSTASDEVHRFLYGRRGRVSYAELSVPETNIRYGTAYLHILLNRYFANVKNSEMRESCVIAAYNMGPNRFIRLYGRTPEAAAAAINAMSPEEFHADLQSRLPARETRYYLTKVRKMKRLYAALGD
ncbi:MAG: lytic transglycosylase domain-containing protein [Desulfovibrio sp.]|nr:lytic transglycosylase domain-containing protein [Desulfovibrio sp.]